ncbi:aldehyde dehydrogenase family protein [Microbacterium sp. NPDC077184]|uniref:aldehyde dehydrogenase family protein n=1 Tax=Microbacterium sp. NPDC077184 TaxID=3154764 RepID=UPI0034314A2F
MGEVMSIDPRTGDAVESVATETSDAEVDAICEAAAAGADALAATSPAEQADLLDAMAAALDAARAELVTLAERESALGKTRLDGELTRTTGQLRLFADVIRDGAMFEAIIDHASGAAPDLRRVLIPLGPVAVFGASNFPFAFSAAGGDTASALAAGCPVVIKAHGAHPALDAAVARTLSDTARAHGHPHAVSIVFGRDAGRRVVEHPAISAVGFTGSESVGRLLMDVAADRERPIPVYAEMGSLNPLIVLPDAVERANLAHDLASSITLGAGQFCTKPGLVFLPAGPEGDAVVDSLVRAMSSIDATFLLSAGIRDSFVAHVDTVAGAGADLLVTPHAAEGSSVTPGLAHITAASLLVSPEVLIECFGPAALVVRYDGHDQLLDALRAVPASLTVSIFAGEARDNALTTLIGAAQKQSGRVILNSVPTGVAVTWAQNHAGPYPASSGGGMFTSVGATAVRRFQRPVAYQGMTEDVLPAALRDDNPWHLPRRIDGVEVPG